MAIEERLRQASFSPNVEIRFAWEPTVDEIERQLRDFAPNIVHYSGHGSRRGELVVPNNSGTGYAIPREAFTRLLSLLGPEIRGVVLNACAVRQQAEELAQKVDWVIGMDQAIRDTSALHFAASFYTSLAAGDDVERAFQLGKSRIRSSGAMDSEVPQLILRSGVDPTKVRFVRQVNLFCIYPKDGESVFKELSVWLKPLQRAAAIRLSGLHEVTIGARRQALIESQIDQAHIFLLLVNSEFLGSDECYELSRSAMQCTSANRAIVVPLILGPCSWQQTPFGALQPIHLEPHNDAEPNARADAWMRAISELRDVVKSQERSLLEAIS